MSMHEPATGSEEPQRPVGSDDASASGMPRWVKVFLIVAVAVAALVVAALITGHGPGRHMGHGSHVSEAGARA
ncbi:hypothetical protein GCM10009682_28030 [Luedemannella flava]|uniref:Uncharacterized protein n=1 Tax=Luedemannella flava TaxID=349316 RepID=A0ABP4Y5Q3_9ACTN